MLLRSARTVDATAARPTAGRILRHGDHGLGVLDGDRGDFVVVRGRCFTLRPDFSAEAGALRIDGWFSFVRLTGSHAEVREVSDVVGTIVGFRDAPSTPTGRSRRRRTHRATRRQRSSEWNARPSAATRGDATMVTVSPSSWSTRSWLCPCQFG